MGFTGWPDEAIEFFEGLEADNSRTYWHSHKAVYDECVRRPMEELLASLEPSQGPGKIFRPNRDIRFSHDKSPYKTNIAATMDKGGYVSLSADGFGVGTGMYMMATDQLARYRAAVDDAGTGTRLARLAAKLEATGVEVSAHEALKTAPRGYAKDHPRIDLLRLKGLIAWQHWEVGPWLATAEPASRVTSFLKAAKPLVAWLDDNVGSSELPARP